MASRPSTAQESSPRPNIVIILADDLGHGDPGCYNKDSKVPTPHIDKLSKQGIRFTDAHTPSSVCSPTRYGLLTGRYAWRTSLKKSVLWPYDPPLIAKDRITLPHMLGKIGYRTACIGKWHLGWEWPRHKGAAEFALPKRGVQGRKQRMKIGLTIDFSQRLAGGPVDRGFDSYFGDDVPNHPPFCFIQDDQCVEQPDTMRTAKQYGWPGPAVEGWDFTAVMPRLAAKAREYIETHAKTEKAKPFFLYLTLTAPHTPIAPAKQFLGKSKAGAYGDFVHEVDWTVGEVTQALKATGLDKNTILIFTSDNGSPGRDGTGMSGAVSSVTKKYDHDPNHPWRGVKADIWEAGHRVPFLIRWPGKLSTDTTNDAPICLTDLYATIASIVDVDLANDQAEDSFDFLPVLLRSVLRSVLPKAKDQATPTLRRPHLIHHSFNGTFAIRKGPWKLIVDNLGSGGFSKPAQKKPGADDPQGQLYNLDTDPGETQNLYAKHPEIVTDLRSLLATCREQKATRPLR